MFAQNLYPALLRELYGDDEAIQRSRLRGVQKQVSTLRDQYKRTPPGVNYADIETRTAYLLAYYPHYIMVLARILNGVQDTVRALITDVQNPMAGFFGAGAGPEILGWLHCLQSLQPDLQEATAYTFDLVHWDRELEITQVLAAELFPSIRLHLHHQQVNLTETLPTYYLQRALGSAQFIIVQNCLNDLPKAHHEAFIHNMDILLEYAQPGTLFITTDFIYEHVRSLMERIQQRAQKQGHYVLQTLERDLCYAPIPLVPIVREELLTGVGTLTPRRKTQYHSLGVQVSPNAERVEVTPQPARLGLDMRFTHFEKLIFQNLAKLDKSSYTYLHHPKVDTDVAPDLVIMSRDKGVIVAEIRDWRGVQPTDDGRLKVVESNGAEAIYDNPAIVAQETAAHLKNLYFERCRELKMEKDTVSFPWTTLLLMPRIRQATIEGWVTRGIFPPGMVWGYETCCSSEALIAAITQVKGTTPQNTLSLTDGEIETTSHNLIISICTTLEWIMRV
ncbi:MAG: NERD domain-containing protein [Anaerolineae bacterium]|nr:NERD domain-containing protein [Anaerolineae bacterium]